MKNLAISIFLALIFSGCSRYPSENEIPQDLESEAQLLIETKGIGDISSDEWPDSISQLKPESVQLKKEGLYIQTWSRFVEQGGLFIPRERNKELNQGTDPGYWKANDEIYYYIFKG
jgi:hypothetical protein